MASFFLGCAHLPIKSGNLLSNAFHPLYGWVWTDGHAVHFLMTSEDGDIGEGATSVKLGDYGTVRRVSWSAHTEEFSTRCYLAVQESNLATIWEVFGRRQNPEFRVTKKIEGVTDLKDIVWHPVCPVLCLVSSSGSWLHCLDPDWSVHLGCHGTSAGCWTPDGRTLVLAEEEGSLSIFRWEDVSRCKDNWTKKKLTIDRYRGKIRCTKAASSRHVIATTDLPLADVISQSNRDMFIPLIINPTTPSNRTLITEISGTPAEDLSKNVAKEVTPSFEQLERPCRVAPINMVDSLKDEITSRRKGLIDLTAMLSAFGSKKADRKETVPETLAGKEELEVSDSHKNSELKAEDRKDEKDVDNCLKGDDDDGDGKRFAGASPLFMHERFVKKEELEATRTQGWNAVSGGRNTNHTSAPIFERAEMTDLEDSAHIHVLDVSSEEPSIVNSCKVPEMLSPDLVVFEARSNNLYVGSRSNQKLQVYNIRNGNLKKAEHRLGLSDQERPVGIHCGIHGKTMSVLVSKPAALSADVTFPMATGTQQVDLYLKQLHLG